MPLLVDLRLSVPRLQLNWFSDVEIVVETSNLSIISYSDPVHLNLVISPLPIRGGGGLLKVKNANTHTEASLRNFQYNFQRHPFKNASVPTARQQTRPSSAIPLNIKCWLTFRSPRTIPFPIFAPILSGTPAQRNV